MALKHIDAIAHLGEKALESGGKSEDQPFCRKNRCQCALGVRAQGDNSDEKNSNSWDSSF